MKIRLKAVKCTGDRFLLTFEDLVVDWHKALTPIGHRALRILLSHGCTYLGANEYSIRVYSNDTMTRVLFSNPVTLQRLLDEHANTKMAVRVVSQEVVPASANDKKSEPAAKAIIEVVVKAKLPFTHQDCIWLNNAIHGKVKVVPKNDTKKGVYSLGIRQLITPGSSQKPPRAADYLARLACSIQ